MGTEFPFHMIKYFGTILDAGKDRGQKEKRASEDEVAGWHHR